MPDDSDSEVNKPDRVAGALNEPVLVTHPPEVPRLEPKLPVHPKDKLPSPLEAAGYSKSVMATSAVSAFLTPIIALCLGGYWLDQKLKHPTPWLAMVGVIVGLALGVASLIRVLEKLSK